VAHAPSEQGQFPLHTAVHRIAHEGQHPQRIIAIFMGDTPRPITPPTPKL
jgi:hypothetical protein